MNREISSSGLGREEIIGSTLLAALYFLKNCTSMQYKNSFAAVVNLHYSKGLIRIFSS